MKIDAATRTISLDTEPCSCTWGNGTPGKQPGRKTCPTCNGTRRGPRGKIGGCRACYNGTVPDFANLVTCERCNGTASVPETTCSRLPDDVRRMFWDITPVRVFLADRGISFNESYLGLGTLYSMADYGRAWEGMEKDREGTLRKITDEMRKESIQATTIMDKSKRLCDHIVVIITRGGYSVRPSFKADSTDLIRRANGELAEPVALMVGAQLAEKNMNGTLIAAAYSKPNNVPTTQVA